MPCNHIIYDTDEECHLCTAARGKSECADLDVLRDVIRQAKANGQPIVFPADIEALERIAAALTAKE